MCISLGSLLQIYFWVWQTVNTEILKVYFKFTSELEKRYKCTSKTDTKYTWSIIITTLI